LSATFNCNVRKVKQCIKVNVHECDTQLKVPYYTIFTSDPEEPGEQGHCLGLQSHSLILWRMT
jgi:hypothetical protein